MALLTGWLAVMAAGAVVGYVANPLGDRIGSAFVGLFAASLGWWTLAMVLRLVLGFYFARRGSADEGQRTGWR